MTPEDRTGPDRRDDAQIPVAPDLFTLPRASAFRRSRPAVLFAIALGGAAGTPARYALSRIIHVAPGSFPWSTFTTNLTGSFVLGVLLTLIVERWPPNRYLRPFAAIGFLGAYTTFSTYMVDADVLGKDGHAGIAALYVITTLVGGLVAVYVGIVVARLLPGRSEEAR